MLAAVPVVGVASIAGVGWTYVLRQDGLLGAGPKVSDALPLLQLAGADAQPLTRVAVAWLLAGLMSGLAMYRWRRIRRHCLPAFSARCCWRWRQTHRSRSPAI